MTYTRPLLLSSALVALAGLALAGCDDDPQSPGTGTGNSAAPTATTPASSSTSMGSTSDSSSSSSGSSTAAPLGCTPPQRAFHPAGCPNPRADTFHDFPVDCYQACDNASSPCPQGTRCLDTQTHPCPAKPGAKPDEANCGACAREQKLCLPILKGQACTHLVGSYKDPELKECGALPDGVAKCNWTLQLLNDGSFRWRYSDIGEIGQFYCHEGTIYLARDLLGTNSGPSFTATFDPLTKTVDWDGVKYLLDPNP